ncbi:MAG: hypothetical protein RR123_02620 [Clostridia bacterium]
MIKEINYKQYGKCVSIGDDHKELIVTVGFGPRIIFFGFKDGENLMYEDINDNINKGGNYFDTNFKNGEMWHIYGGHRLWKSPEDLASYAPDNYPVKFTIDGNYATFVADVEKMTHLQKTIKIGFEQGELTIVHSFTNCDDDEEIKCSMWGLSVLDKGGVAILPQNLKDTGLLANRNIVLWPYTKINDKRLSFFDDKIVIKQDSKCGPLKIGFLNTEKTVNFINKGMLFVKKFESDLDAEYPDFCCNTECYTNEFMTEVETLSEIYTIMPNRTVSATEKWYLYDSNSVEYKEMLKKSKESK